MKLRRFQIDTLFNVLVYYNLKLEKTTAAGKDVFHYSATQKLLESTYLVSTTGSGCLLPTFAITRADELI